MIRAIFLLIAVFNFLVSRSQEDFFVLKKKNKTLQRFSAGSFIVFQLHTGEWVSGHITRLVPDSFYVRRQSVRYTMFGADTVHLGNVKVAFSDVTAMPRKCAMIFYCNDKPQLIHGHEKFAYVKNGLLFQLPGGGYAALNIAGDIRGHEPLFDRQNRNRLGIAVLVFAFGEILHLSYRQHLHLGKNTI